HWIRATPVSTSCTRSPRSPTRATSARSSWATAKKCSCAVPTAGTTSEARATASRAATCLPASRCRCTAPAGPSNDDRDRAAVGAPGGARHVAGTRRAEEGDHGGDLLGLGEPAERAPGGDLGEHLVALALLVGEPTLTQPRLRGGRARRDR